MLKLLATAIFCVATAMPSHAISDEELAKRQCRSVHLGYTKAVEDASYAYMEVKVDKSSPGTYFCALGFHMGYLGMQEKSDGQKVIIFSIWEPHHGEVPADVPEDKRAELIRKGEGVVTARFGGEGTGGQSFFSYDWQTGETVRFLVKSVRVNETTSRYTGFFFNNKTNEWQLMTEFQTLAQGKQLGGFLYSFVEDFRRNYESATISRKANYFNGAASSDGKTWIPLRNAQFSADGTPSEAIDAGAISNGFFLQTGGETEQKTNKLWSQMSATAGPEAPAPTLPKEIADAIKAADAPHN